MMYPYMTLSDETEITHSNIIEENERKIIIVHFERPTENGFDVARCQLPDYKWIKKEGYTDSEVKKFEEFLKYNAHLFFKYAALGGINIA